MTQLSCLEVVCVYVCVNIFSEKAAEQICINHLVDVVWHLL